MREKKIKQYIKEHPELLSADDDTATFIPDGEIPDIQWFLEENRGLLGEKETRTKKKPWYQSKWFLVPTATVLVFGIFCATTPIGNATADIIYDTLVEWFTGKVTIRSQSGRIQPGQEDPDTVQETSFRTLGEVRAEFKVKIAENEAAAPEKIIVQADDAFIRIISTHTTPGGAIVLNQLIMYVNSGGTSIVDINHGQPLKEALPDGTEITGYVDAGSAYAVGHLEDMTIEISSESITYDEFVNFIKGIRIK
ncbi:MAG: hypothetical protein ACYCX2_01845 [Christensenellales bacterium]